MSWNQGKICAKPPKASRGPTLDILSTPPARRLGEKLVQRIVEAGRRSSYEKGQILFAQGQQSRGVFLLVEGLVKLSLASSDGNSLILGFSGPETILGLAATVLDETHVTSAQAVAPTTAVVLPRDIVLRLVQENTTLAFEAVEMLSAERYDLLDHLSAIGLSKSASQRLAGFLVRLRQDSPDHDDSVHIRLAGVTQDDLAHMLGVSRETTSRLLSRFRKRHVLQWERSTLLIRDWRALRRLAAPAPTKNATRD